MEDIYINEKQSAMIVERKDDGKHKIQLILSEDENGDIDDIGILLSALAVKITNDEYFLQECKSWFMNYISGKSCDNTEYILH